MLSVHNLEDGVGRENSQQSLLPARVRASNSSLRSQHHGSATIRHKRGNCRGGVRCNDGGNNKLEGGTFVFLVQFDSLDNILFQRGSSVSQAAGGEELVLQGRSFQKDDHPGKLTTRSAANADQGEEVGIEDGDKVDPLSFDDSHGFGGGNSGGDTDK